VKAIVVPAPRVEPSGDRLIAYLQERIARYKCPRSVAFIEALPRNATGKVLKRVLRETYSE
jgi:acyl-CoA synthetase (AMP-forming)/AMP-acid ligase II